MTSATTTTSAPSTNDNPPGMGGIMSSFARAAGKGLALAAVAAVSLPLIFAGQAAGILPGAKYSTGYTDIGQQINRVVQDVTGSGPDFVVIQPANHKEHHYQGYYHQGPPGRILDTQISGGEALAGMAVGAAMAAGSLGAAAIDRKIQNDNDPAPGTIFAAGSLQMMGEGLKALWLPAAAGTLINAASQNRPGNPGQALMAGAGLVAATMAATVPYVLTTAAVYDNFIRPAKP